MKGVLLAYPYPPVGKPMSWRQDAIMPEKFHRHPIWKIRPWAKDAGHFIHERARFRW